jgi:hypothetical protein
MMQRGAKKSFIRLHMQKSTSAMLNLTREAVRRYVWTYEVNFGHVIIAPMFIC